MILMITILSVDTWSPVILTISEDMSLTSWYKKLDWHESLAICYVLSIQG